MADFAGATARRSVVVDGAGKGGGGGGAAAIAIAADPNLLNYTQWIVLDGTGEGRRCVRACAWCHGSCFVCSSAFTSQQVNRRRTPTAPPGNQ